jgi:hypothetical protein
VAAAVGKDVPRWSLCAPLSIVRLMCVVQNLVIGSYQCGGLLSDRRLSVPWSLLPTVSACVLAPLIVEACRLRSSRESSVELCSEVLRDRRLANVGVACASLGLPGLGVVTRSRCIGCSSFGTRRRSYRTASSESGCGSVCVRSCRAADGMLSAGAFGGKLSVMDQVALRGLTPKICLRAYCQSHEEVKEAFRARAGVSGTYRRQAIAHVKLWGSFRPVVGWSPINY